MVHGVTWMKPKATPASTASLRPTACMSKQRSATGAQQFLDACTAFTCTCYQLPASQQAEISATELLAPNKSGTLALCSCAPAAGTNAAWLCTYRMTCSANAWQHCHPELVSPARSRMQLHQLTLA